VMGDFDMGMERMWNDEREVREAGVFTPDYVKGGVTFSTVAAIYQGGCESGAYMPAVTYYDARQTMAEHGDEIVDDIRDSGAFDENYLAIREDEDFSWYCCRMVSAAVEFWAYTTTINYCEEDGRDD
jgi:hypothetical protein